MQKVSFLWIDGYSAYILKGLPLFLVVLTSKDRFYNFLHPLLNPENSERNESSGLEGPVQAITDYFGDDDREEFDFGFYSPGGMYLLEYVGFRFGSDWVVGFGNEESI